MASPAPFSASFRSSRVAAVLTYTHHQQKDLHERLGFGVLVKMIIRITIWVEPRTCSIREQTKEELE
jgi:cytochrome b561